MSNSLQGTGSSTRSTKGCACSAPGRSGAYALFDGLAISVVTFMMLAMAAVIFATLHVDETPPEKEEGQTFWEEVAKGVRHLRGVPVLARMTLALGVAFAMTGLANTTIFAVIEQGSSRSPPGSNRRRDGHHH